MKMAKATEKDMDTVGNLTGILEDISKGYYPRKSDGCCDEDDGPTLFDPDSRDHLRQLYDRVKECLDASPGGLARVVGGFHTLMHNNVVDPDKDYLDFHPRLTASLADVDRLEWLLRNVSGAEFRRIGVVYGGNCGRDRIDAAMR